MAQRQAATHPKPSPVRLSRKVIDEIVPEVCLDADHESLWEDDPAKFLAAYDRLGEYARFVELLMSGELTEAWQVLRTQKQLRKRQELLAEEIGNELLRVDAFEGKARRRVEREVAEEIKGLRKRARRLRKASLDCSRFWQEWQEWKHDREAIERLDCGAPAGGEG